MKSPKKAMTAKLDFRIKTCTLTTRAMWRDEA
jgi:hypothetical protein